MIRSAIKYILLGLITLQVFYVSYGIVVNPIPTGDAYGIWFLKAEVIGQVDGISQLKTFFADPRFSYSHPEYPLLWPSVLSLVESDFLKMSLYPLLFIWLLILVYQTLREKSDTNSASLATFLTSSVVALERLGGRNEVGFADLPLSVCYLLFLKTYYKDRINYFAVSLILATMANIKMEGLLSAIILLLLIRPRKIIFWILTLPLILWWPVLSYLWGLKTIYQSEVMIPAVINRIPSVIFLLIKEIINFRYFGLVIVIYLFSLLTKSSSKTRLINFWVLIYVLVLTLSYLITPLDVTSHWQSSFYRIMSTMIPIMIINSFIMNQWSLKRKYWLDP